MYVLLHFEDEYIISVTAKAVRPGHYPACCPTNPFFLRGFNEHPFAFYKAACHVRKNQEEAAPATPEGEPHMDDTNSNRNSPTKNVESQSNDERENVQDNMWEKPMISQLCAWLLKNCLWFFYVYLPHLGEKQFDELISS